MLDTLRRIVQEVSAAPDLEAALNIIVDQVKRATDADVCSVYLIDKPAQQYVLMATDGLNPQAVGVLRVPLGNGLISMVAEREEPVNVADAAKHPQFQLFPEADEQDFHAFLGVPIIHHRAVMGVLVVRHQAKRRFDDHEEAFLVTAASQLAGAIAHAETSGEVAKLLSHRGVGERALGGISGAAGVVVGTVMVAYPSADLAAIPDRGVDDIELEVKVFECAVARVRTDIEGLSGRLSELAAEDKALFDAYLMMLSSDSIVGKTIKRIRRGSWASGALRDTIQEHARLFDEMEDPYLRERASDVRDLGRRILLSLQSGERRTPPYHKKTILVGDEISAAMLAEVPRDCLAGVVSVRGSALSHVAILAHAMGIPAVLGVEDLPVSRIDHCEMVVDGYRGRVYISPSSAVKSEYQRLEREEEELAAGLEELRDLPAETPDGVRVPLYANAGLVSDLIPSLSSGAEGIGLYRTEFPFMIRDGFPGEEEQRQTYRQILQAFAPRPVVLRTLDIGGDKSLPYFPIVEDNPFLGWRGIRVTLDHPDIFLVQVRAMLKAGMGLENLHILLPMISSVAELDEAFGLLSRAHQELVADGVPVPVLKVGVMLEVPSTIYLIDAFAERVDYFSIGTNDLTQYMLAVDRNNPRVARFYDSLHPSILAALKHIVDAVHRNGKQVGVCGEMAGDPAAVIALLGLGVDSLSMSVSSMSRVKWVVRNFSTTQARGILHELFRMNDAQTVRSYLDDLLDSAGMGGLVRAGK